MGALVWTRLHDLMGQPIDNTEHRGLIVEVHAELGTYAIWRKGEHDLANGTLTSPATKTEEILAIIAGLLDDHTYTVGLPVTVTVKADGTVSYEIDTADAALEIWNSTEDNDYTVEQVQSDAAQIGNDHNVRHHWPSD